MAMRDRSEAESERATTPPMSPNTVLSSREAEANNSVTAMISERQAKRWQEERKDNAEDARETISEAEAKIRLKKWNFDPEDCTKETSGWFDSRARQENAHIIDYDQRVSCPIIIFPQLGDTEMLKYILDKCGKDADDQAFARKDELAREDEHGLFPLYVAVARNRNEDDIILVCRFLLENGADLAKTLGGEGEYSTFFRATAFGYDKVAQWLLSQGALLSTSNRDDNSKPQFALGLAGRDLPPASNCDDWIRDRTIRKLFASARETVKTRSNVLLFLSGSLVAPSAKETVSGSSSPLQAFNGHSGILEIIATSVGVETNEKLLCTAEGLVQYEQRWTNE